MYYKIASLVLNTGKHQTGSREVYVAQPDAVKENLAGKLFLLAEIDGKKTDLKKVIDFIISSLDDFYYNDEKIFLQDKIEGLTLDNIFEAALAKLNKALLEFLSDEKIVLRAEDTNLVLGLVFENKLLFSNFGRNKAFLIYKRQEEYELINVEASAADLESQEELPGPVVPKFFSSVISGEIPTASYFLFCNEALPEYLSNKELINIITKLPPMVAVEQIKGSLAKLNSYVPFLGIIVKNTFGLSGNDTREDAAADVSQSAHNSISHLNYTEKKTEQMLAPAGLINWQKLSRTWKKMRLSIAPAQRSLTLKNPVANKSLPPLSRQTTVSAARMIKEKMAFGRSHYQVFGVFKGLGATLINLFNPLFWKGAWKNGRAWLSSLQPRNKAMFFLLSFALVVLLASLVFTSINNRRQAELEYFNNLIIALESKKSMIDSYLLYNNQEGAKTLIGESLASLDELQVKGTEQTSRRDSLRAAIEQQRAKLQKLTVVENPELIGDFKNQNPSAETRNLLVSEDLVYAADPAGKAVYILNLQDKKTSSLLLSGDINSLDKPVLENGFIYYLNGNRLVKLNKESGTNNILNIDGVGADDKIDSFQFYNNYLYLLLADLNKIYRFSANANGFAARADWVKDGSLLSDAADLAINSDIFVLKNGGQIDRFKVGRKLDFALEAIDPSLDSASLLSEAGDKLYILDRQSKRLLIFTKEGKLSSQYRLPSLNNIKDFSLSDDQKAAYILNDNAVYKINLE